MKRIIAWILTFATLFSLLPFAFAAEEISAVSPDSGEVSTQTKSGKCGENLTWSFDETTGTFSVFGTGGMYYYGSKPLPWDSFKDEIIRIEIAEGVQSLTNYAFMDCDNLVSIEFPESMDVIDQGAFLSCSALTKIVIPSNACEFLDSAFSYCTNLTEVCFEGSVAHFDTSVFEGCKNIKIVRIKELMDWFLCEFTYVYDEIPNMIPEIGANPLYYGADLYVNDEKVTHLVVPNGVTTVQEALFRNCSSITSIVLPESVSEIEFNAFTCPNLTDVVFMNPKCEFSVGSFNGLIYTIHGASGSSAEDFAIKNKRTFHACNYVDNGDGTHYYYCTTCKTAKVENLPHDTTGDFCYCGYSEKCSHDYQNKVTFVPTCTENGELVKTCSLCGFSMSFVLPAKGHDLISKVTEPTCTEQGYTTYSCIVCGVSFVDDYTDALLHNYELVEVPPTCTEKGYTAYICSKCGDSYVTEETEIIPHTYEATVTAPTCTEQGYTTYTCSACGDSYTEDFADAIGHDWSDWTPIDPYTEERTCQNCGKVETHETAQMPNPFTDISQEDYFYDPVLWAVKKGITNGTSATTFSPNEPCTRAQIVTFLWRAYGCVEPTSTENPFTDVDSDAYYYKAVLWAVENGITTGMSATTFAPDAICTRGQAVTFLYRAAGQPTVTASENPFTDVLETDYFYNAVLWAVEKGITMGISNGKFGPNPSCTRSQIVTFLYRMFE